MTTFDPKYRSSLARSPDVVRCRLKIKLTESSLEVSLLEGADIIGWICVFLERKYYVMRRELEKQTTSE